MLGGSSCKLRCADISIHADQYGDLDRVRLGGADGDGMYACVQCACVRVSTCVYVCLRVSMCVCVYIYMYVCNDSRHHNCPLIYLENFVFIRANFLCAGFRLTL